MALMPLAYVVLVSLTAVDAMKEIIVESPFYLRARVHDSQTASVQFEIARENDQRTCRMYKFTVRRNRETAYAMPEQNLTFWRNSLELKHLAVGEYRICAVICSEHGHPLNSTLSLLLRTNRTRPITACLNIRAFRSHFLILTLYFLVFTFLALSQLMFTLRKRKVHARIKLALAEVEHAVQKWRTSQTPSASIDQTQSYAILQSLVTLPASPIEHSISSPMLPTNDDDDEPFNRTTCPIIFHLDETP